MTSGISIQAKLEPGFERILSFEALEFVAKLHRKFNPTRIELLQKRTDLQSLWNKGQKPSSLSENSAIRNGVWKVASIPHDLEDRRVEITGPCERKMMIHALNSGAKVFMADLEDSLSPTWLNVVQGQINLYDANRHQLSFSASDGKILTLKPVSQLATLVVRPRGWHLIEKHLLIDGQPVSASLFDFGLYFFHNAAHRIDQGTGPYFYLPKLESADEARLWNDVFYLAQKELGLPHGSIRSTVLIETHPAAFQMEEILYELQEHICGLNAGRWDYIFSVIKKLRTHRDAILPDRSQVTMTVPFMKAYCERIVRLCHKRGAHAMGGMSAFVPSRKDPSINERAFAQVREDKKREAQLGFDGTWVAHPDLVPIAQAEFDSVLGTRPNQIHKLLSAEVLRDQDLQDFTLPQSSVTEAGVRSNISVALQYLTYWLSGTGAAAIHNLMEDAATAEIARAQLWQWIHHQVKLADGRSMSQQLYEQIRDQELGQLQDLKIAKLKQARELLDHLVCSEGFADFLTVPAYEYLEGGNR